ncbi:MAG: regulatory protein GemA [Sphingobium limneticum]
MADLRKPRSLNPKRVRLVQVARKALGLDEEAYRAILRDHGGAESATALTINGFDRVMDRFRYLGFVSDKRKASFSPNDRMGMATAAQIVLIRDLWAKLSRDGSDAALNKWIGRFGVDALRFADADCAKRILGALRAWERRLATNPAPDAESRSSYPFNPS